MKTINTHIEEVLEKFNLTLVKWRSDRQPTLSLVQIATINTLLKQSLLDLHTQTIAETRKEVEKKKNTAILGTEESSQAYKHKTHGYHRAIQDVLDLLDKQRNNAENII